MHSPVELVIEQSFGFFNLPHESESEGLCGKSSRRVRSKGKERKDFRVKTVPSSLLLIQQSHYTTPNTLDNIFFSMKRCSFGFLNTRYITLWNASFN